MCPGGRKGSSPPLHCQSRTAYTAIDEFTRLRFPAAYSEQSSCSSDDFLEKLVKWYARRGIQAESVQTDNGTEFTNRFLSGKQDCPTLFEKTTADLGNPLQTHSPLYTISQRQGRAPPQGGPEALFLPG